MNPYFEMLSCNEIVGWFFNVLRPAQEYFTYMETSPLPVKGCKIQAYGRRSGPLSREGSLSCHKCCDTGPRFFRSHPKDRPILSPYDTPGGVENLFLLGFSRVPFQSPFTTHKGMWRIYSNLDPHGVMIVTQNLWHCIVLCTLLTFFL
jgi:hypothetical protein